MAFPSIDATSTSSERSDATSHTVDLPSGVSDGDLLIAFFAQDTFDVSGHSVSWPSPWVEMYDIQFEQHIIGSAAYLYASGGETSVIVTTTLSDRSEHIVYRISEHDSGTVIEWSTATGSTNTADPPSLTPSWGAEDTLWLIGASFDRPESNGPATDDPDNYTDAIESAIFTDATNAWGRSLRRNLNATSDDPNTFTTLQNEQWVIGLVAIRPISVILDQEGFRFRNDDGSESAATWRQNQDVNDSIAKNSNIRLRLLINATDDPSSEQFLLEYKENADPDAEYRAVLLT